MPLLELGPVLSASQNAEVGGLVSVPVQISNVGSVDAVDVAFRQEVASQTVADTVPTTLPG